MDNEKKEIGKLVVWIIVLLVFTTIVFGVLSSMGLIGNTYVERKVFENSYQRHESVRTEIATFEAQLVEIERKLSSSLDEQTRVNLEAQASSIRIMLSVAQGK